jgi:DNA-3-methyladenine glycosylase I
LLLLEGAQAGLSWLTVLKRRDAYRRAFANFNPASVARYDAARVRRVLADPGIIRHPKKVASAVVNAASFLKIQAELGSFDAFIWGFVGGDRVVNHWTASAEIPATTLLAQSVSSGLRRRGFSFVGPTICYSYL